MATNKVSRRQPAKPKRKPSPRPEDPDIRLKRGDEVVISFKPGNKPSEKLVQMQPGQRLRVRALTMQMASSKSPDQKP